MVEYGRKMRGQGSSDRGTPRRQAGPKLAKLTVVLSSVALIGAACGSAANSTTSRLGASSTTPTSLSVQVFPGAFISLPDYVAQSLGLFTKKDLNVTLQPIAAGNTAVGALAAGRVDIINNSMVNTAELLVQGKAFVAVGGTMKFPSTTLVAQSSIVKGATSAIGAIRALEGKPIAVPAVGAEAQLDVEALLALAGASPTDATFIPTGGFGAPMVAAMKDHQVDAAISIDPGTTLMEQQGGSQAVADFRSGSQPTLDPVNELQAGIRWSTAQVIAQKGAAIERYNEAIDKALSFIRNPKNWSKVVQIWSAVGGIKGSLADSVLQANAQTFGTSLNCRTQLAAAKKLFTLVKSPVAKELDAISCGKIFWSKGSFGA